MELLMAFCCCGPFVLVALWFLMIKSSVDRDNRKGRCASCSGRGKVFQGTNSYSTTCTSCNGTGQYRPYS
ncbi:hypothetical protein KOI35_03305 [Actinoplanes bogorensis]|uniref:CR-type domain-containing protein n=1 Tax=Paractinoplanes bogorensis TaxID=1610840 RepID=A0ABS5YGC1_9ACTN|nr:hypothetical protein [Actinoplanes bogorensis]MBU2662529.1 hypothetical protein [Actinoplanes bogorensis]